MQSGMSGEHISALQVLPTKPLAVPLLALNWSNEAVAFPCPLPPSATAFSWESMGFCLLLRICPLGAP